MLRSVHMKLVMIMVLLILSLMAVVGAFLINSVMAFYLEEFYTQMSQVFDQSQNPALSRTLQTENSGEENGAEAVLEIMQAYSGELGLDGRSRTLYILDGETGAYLAGTDEAEGRGLEYNSPNLTRALVEKEEGTQANIAADYMDVALPFSRGDGQYVIYILDNKTTVNSLINQIFVLILESLVFGLFISILLSFLLSKTMIIPIQRLTEGAMRVAEGDFSRRIEVTSRDEIGVLTDTFNDMARQLRDTLRQVENERNKLDTLFLHMTDGVVAFDREGRVIHSNPAAAVMLGCTIGGDTTYGQLFGGLASLEEVMAAPDHLEAERQVRDRCLELLMAPFDREQQGGVLAVLHDVTEQRKNQELQREFVANVSHELRTPLTNIRSYAETLSDSAGDIPPAMEKKFLGVILGESDRMTHIVQDLLTLSRFDSGRDDLKLARFSFEAAVQDLYNAVYMEAQRHSHTLELELEDGLPEVTADRERTVQVMMNIVSNSIKYTPDGGKIVISAGRTGDRVWMQVDDNGIGIPPEDRPRIFERFYRVDKARSRQSGGTGLGLSIAKEIVARHEGVLELVDREGPGLYFDWQGEVPLEVLDGWLSVENPMLTGSVRRMVLAAREGRVFLCYFDEMAGGYYACASDVVSASRLEEVVETLRDNGARFAFETEEYSGLEPCTLVLGEPLSPAVYASVDPLGGSQSLSGLQEALGFPESSASFSGAGEQVIRSRNDTLRIGADGTVTYEPAAEGSDRYLLSGGGVYEAVEGCRDLAQQAVDAVGGEERLFLMSARETGQGGWEIQFGYSLDGVQVRLGEDGWAARFTVEQGQITGFQLRMRCYTDTGTTTVVLPERQAMAAMEAKGHENEELLLVYLDTGAEMVTASWAAASELSGRG